LGDKNGSGCSWNYSNYSRRSRGYFCDQESSWGYGYGLGWSYGYSGGSVWSEGFINGQIGDGLEQWFRLEYRLEQWFRGNTVGGRPREVFHAGWLVKLEGKT
jgi:hypothetical protein